MKPNALLRAVLALFLSLTLISCTGASRQALQEAGERIGRTAAQISLERQPGDCGDKWQDLPARLGEDATSLARRYVEYVRGPINDRTINCYWFNENQRRGLEGTQ